MIWEWYVLIGLVVLGCLVTWAGLSTDHDMWPGELALLNGLVWFGALCFLAVALIGTIGPNIDRNICNKFSRQTGFEVKFIRYNTLSWDCLVRTSRNRWISKDNLQNVVINK